MKFGMNMLLWTDNVTEVHRPVLQRLKDLGYDGVELPVFDLNPDKFAVVGLWLDDAGLERTAVTCRGVDDNPISPDRAVRERALANNKLALECCQAAGATILAGPFHSALGSFSGAAATADELRRGVESIRAMAEHAATCGVTLSVEYLNRFECYLLNTAADTARFCKEVNHPLCRMMYDTFHANIEEKSIADAIRACADMTVHVHISENDRSTPGRGHVAWAETFDTLKQTGYDGWMTVEAFGLALPALAAATRIWRRMFDSEEQLARDGLAFMKQEWRKRS
ncbi:MAG TPA: sugar phosphate isomerase/epimerase family protein [Pirellulales bacterium]|jgi:D-psicose/D-tagatose/L-ribulose 3-epimerase|nr:sugar phosphate isomerase/epimerase family protein [Pirellulales bacterium]